MYRLGPYSGCNCPTIHLRPDVIDRVLEVIAGLLLILMWIFAVYLYIHYPEVDAGGKPILLCAGGFTVLMIAGAWLGYISIHLISFPFRITERNMVIQYRLATRFGRVLNILFGVVGVFMVLAGSEPFWEISSSLFSLMNSITIIVLVVCTAVYYLFAYRNR